MAKQELNLKKLANELEDLREKRAALSEVQELNDDDLDRLEDLEVVEKQIGSLRTASDENWTFIPEDEFVDYIREDAFDCGDIDRNNRLADYIDWQQYADDCSSDWNTVEFDGVTYYWRE